MLFIGIGAKRVSKITALRTGKKNDKRINLYLDGKFAFSVDAVVAEQEGLRVGQELTDARVEKLGKVDQRQRAMDVAFRYLGYRPRSEAELRERLQRRGFSPEAIEEVTNRLKELGMLDDVAFAHFWVENRETFRPRSRLLTGLELKRMGVDREVIEQVVQGADDMENAYRAAVQRTRGWQLADYPDFRRRLGDYLRRRGFSYEVISHVVARIWQKQEKDWAKEGE
jgi:regulatory protein